MTNKIDPIGFACLISKVSAMGGDVLYGTLVREYHDLVLESVISPPVQQPQTVVCSQVDALLAAIQNGQKIEAIKAYRSMTGIGLKESKDAVEKYWYAHPAYLKTLSPLEKEATLGDIVNQATQQR